MAEGKRVLFLQFCLVALKTQQPWEHYHMSFFISRVFIISQSVAREATQLQSSHVWFIM